jgi:1,4-dihydroxy-2-naphthoyl-CoA hydrolase
MSAPLVFLAAPPRVHRNAGALAFSRLAPDCARRLARVLARLLGAFEMNDVVMNEAANRQPPFAEFLGIKITHVSPERVSAELVVREELNNRFNIMHGGAIMALADNLGGTATTANLGPGQSTTTIESKTNFFAAIPIGDVAKAECTPLHRGRTTMVWQTRITRADGKLCAMVTQTQLVLERKK